MMSKGQQICRPSSQLAFAFFSSFTGRHVR
jgi:hypothetical protein